MDELKMRDCGDPPYLHKWEDSHTPVEKLGN